MDPEHPDKHGREFKAYLYRWFFKDNRGAAWAFRDDASHNLRRFWKWAGEDLDPRDRRPPTGMEALGKYSIQGYQVRIVQCPEPRALALNHFVAIAWKPGRRTILPWKKHPDDVRYLALESTLRVMGSEEDPPTVLGEWVRGFHINYGVGPEPGEAAFRDAIERILADQQPIVAVLNLADGTVVEPREPVTLSGP